MSLSKKRLVFLKRLVFIISTWFLGYYFSSALSPGSIYFSTSPGQNYFFAAPTYQNYFFTALNYQNYYFTALLLENISCLSVLSKFQTFRLCILLRLKSRSVRRASHHPIFMGNCPVIGHTFLVLSTQWMSAPSRK